MTLTVFLTVILAALLHATWNAIVKGAADKELNLAGVIIGHAPYGLAIAIIAPFPAPESWPYLAAGAVLHLGYQLFLLASYKLGDLSQVYPIARGSAPMIVAAVSVFALGVSLSNVELTAIFLIGAGILSLTAARQSDGLRNRQGALFAFTTGCFIAGYSIIDGLGARLSGTSLGFYAWLALINAIIFALFFSIRRPSLLPKLFREGRTVLIVGGGASYVAYGLVIWAFTQAPIALVTALRETSIIFALFIAIFFLKERINLAKIMATMLTISGVALLRFVKN